MEITTLQWLCSISIIVVIAATEFTQILAAAMKPFLTVILEMGCITLTSQCCPNPRCHARLPLKLMGIPISYLRTTGWTEDHILALGSALRIENVLYFLYFASQWTHRGHFWLKNYLAANTTQAHLKFQSDAWGKLMHALQTQPVCSASGSVVRPELILQYLADFDSECITAVQCRFCCEMQARRQSPVQELCVREAGLVCHHCPMVWVACTDHQTCQSWLPQEEDEGTRVTV